jgi:hypothetical protein
MRRLLNDVQRDMTFYEVVVGFRNAIELMQIIRGRPLDPTTCGGVSPGTSLVDGPTDGTPMTTV